MADSLTLAEEHAIVLSGLRHRHERAMALLTSPHGPLGELGVFPGDVAGLAYLIWLARRRARAPGGMLSGRPAYEADDTLRGRVIAAASCSGSPREFGTVLFERLNLSLAALPARDLLWWRTYQDAVTASGRWHDLIDDTTLTEVLTAVAMLGEFMHQIPAFEEAAHA